MMLKKQVETARRTRPAKFTSPVIAGRVPESLHRLIKGAAKRSGRTMSDELAWRAAVSFEWEKAFGEARKVVAEAHRIIEGDLRGALRANGFTPIYDLAGTYWKEPGMPADARLKVVPTPEMKVVIAEAVKETLAQIKEDSQ
jgi:hypothetical protein